MSNNWINEENARAEKLSQTGGTANHNAPRLVKAKKRVIPARSVRSIYLQESHSKAFDRLVFEQKMVKGKKSPDLIEEAIELLLKKYNQKLEA